MAEGVLAQAKEGLTEVPHQLMSKPITALVAGIVFLLLVLTIEAFKPGLITGPIKSLLNKVGIHA